MRSLSWISIAAAGVAVFGVLLSVFGDGVAAGVPVSIGALAVTLGVLSLKDE